MDRWAHALLSVHSRLNGSAGWMDEFSMGWMERCCFSFALQERRS